jgi:hypothetical protein
MPEVQIVYGFIPKLTSGAKYVGTVQAVDLLFKRLEQDKFKLYRQKYQLIASMQYYLDHLYSLGARVFFYPEEVMIVIDNPKYEETGMEQFTIHLYIKEYAF